MAADHRPSRPQVPPLRRPALRLRSRPRPLPGLPPRDVRRLLLPPLAGGMANQGVRVALGGRENRPADRGPDALLVPLRFQRRQQRLSVPSRHRRFGAIGPVHPALSVQLGTRGPPDGRRVGAVSGRTGPLPPLPWSGQCRPTRRTAPQLPGLQRRRFPGRSHPTAKIRAQTGRKLPTPKDGASKDGGSRKTGSKVPKQSQESQTKHSKQQRAPQTEGRRWQKAKSSEKAS
jgi:hypothetical protein